MRRVEGAELVEDAEEGRLGRFEGVVAVAGDAQSGVVERTLIPLHQDSEGVDVAPQGRLDQPVVVGRRHP